MSFCFLILLTPKPSTTLLPYTTLFRSPRLLAIHSEVGAADVRNNHSRSGARRARRGRAAQGAVPLALDSGVEPPVGGWPRRDPASRAAPAARPRSGSPDVLRLAVDDRFA